MHAGHPNGNDDDGGCNDCQPAILFAFKRAKTLNKHVILFAIGIDQHIC